MDIIDDALENSDKYLRHFIKTRTVSRQPISLSNAESAELLLGRCDLSQRGYKNLKAILKGNNVNIPPYDQLQKYCNDLDVGRIHSFNHGESCGCMGFHTSVTETLQFIIGNNKLYEQFNFLSKEKRVKCFDYLKSKDPELYSKLDSKCRTILLRSTGDNFRASARMPTEQISFSLLNLIGLANNPYGQFISSLWRGSESREMIEIHCSKHYEELEELVKSGIDLFIGNKKEHFNVVCFLVADLCFIKDVIGQCACTSLYGCYHCHQKNTDWKSKTRKKETEYESKTMSELNKNGIKALTTLGKEPDRDSAKFKKFQHSHCFLSLMNLSEP